jgi:hypothetical protein
MRWMEAHQFHRLKDREKHAHGEHRIRVRPPCSRCAPLRCGNHRVHGLVSHRRTVALEDLANDSEQPARVEELVLDLLNDQVWV